MTQTVLSQPEVLYSTAGDATSLGIQAAIVVQHEQQQAPESAAHTAARLELARLELALDSRIEDVASEDQGSAAATYVAALQAKSHKLLGV
jgi:hypothetical protein